MGSKIFIKLYLDLEILSFSLVFFTKELHLVFYKLFILFDDLNSLKKLFFQIVNMNAIFKRLWPNCA